MLLEHCFDGSGELWWNAYGAMVLEARGNGFANFFALAIFSSNGLLEEVFDSGELVQWEWAGNGLIMLPLGGVVNSRLG